MSEDNILNLVEHLKSHTPIKTMDTDDLGAFSIDKEQTLLRRAFAFLCDFMVIATIKNMISVSYAVFVSEFLIPLSGAQKVAMASPGMAMEVAVFMTIFFTYFFYCNYVLDGKTLGSLLMKLNVIDDNYPFDREQENHQPSLEQTAKRAMGYMVCYLSFGTFFFFSLLNEDKKGLPDFMSGTRVVSDEWLKGFKAHKKFSQEQVRININSLDKAA